MIFTNELPKRTEQRFGYGMKPYVLLECQTNQPATFIWMDCYYRNTSNPCISTDCNKLFQSNLCHNITNDNKQLEVRKYDTASTIIFTPVEPKCGCFGCFAYNGDEHIKSFTKYILRGAYLFDLNRKQALNIHIQRQSHKVKKRDRKRGSLKGSQLVRQNSGDRAFR